MCCGLPDIAHKTTVATHSAPFISHARRLRGKRWGPCALPKVPVQTSAMRTRPWAALAVVALAGVTQGPLKTRVPRVRVRLLERIKEGHTRAVALWVVRQWKVEVKGGRCSRATPARASNALWMRWGGGYDEAVLCVAARLRQQQCRGSAVVMGTPDRTSQLLQQGPGCQNVAAATAVDGQLIRSPQNTSAVMALMSPSLRAASGSSLYPDSAGLVSMLRRDRQVDKAAALESVAVATRVMLVGGGVDRSEAGRLVMGMRLHMGYEACSDFVVRHYAVACELAQLGRVPEAAQCLKGALVGLQQG